MQQKYEEANSCKKTLLDNGLRIITQEVPFLKSVSAGIWVRVGSRFEPASLNGISHFIEHMLFKGTARRSALDIAREIDSVGGILDAFTSKEFTAFYCKVMDENLEAAVDLLCDLFINATFPEDEIEREKQVICQEIRQVEDSPEDLVQEILGINLWKNDPLGQPVFGTIPKVTLLDRKTISEFKRQAYTTAETVVCAAGNLNHERFVDLINEHMGRLPRGSANSHPPAPRVERSYHIVPRDLEQAHLCLGLQGPSATDPGRYTGYILNTILGGGMSSRLFQEVREKNGLAYSVGSYLSTFSDTGAFGIYAGCDPSRIHELLRILGKEIFGLAHTITEPEIRTAINQNKGGMVLSLESSDARMNRLAKGEYYFGRHIHIEEVINSLEAVTAQELSDAAARTFCPGAFTVVAMGPIPDEKSIYQALEE